MPTEYAASGVIVKASKDCCVVSTQIDGSTQKFPFSKSIFYSFGLKCDGDMTNLLEEGSQVDLCYKLRPAGGATISTVWLGDRPDTIADPKPIYDRNGIITHTESGEYIIESDDGLVVLSRDSFFRDGQRAAELTPGDAITFDAAPIEDIDGALVLGATCAWIGPKPRLVDRFNLRVDETEVEFDDVVSGTVAVIPNEVVAFVDVEVEGKFIKVMLFRCSFTPVCDSIYNVVDVGDSVWMKLGCRVMFPGRKQWFARVAVTACDEDSVDMLDEIDELSLDMYDDRIDEVTLDKLDNRIDNLLCDNQTGSEPSGIRIADRDIEPKPADARKTVQYDKNCKMLYSDPPLSGVVSQFSSIACITYGNLKIILDRFNFYVDREPVDVGYFESFVSSGEKTVHFEAVLKNRSDANYSDFTHEATCAWVGKKPPLPAMAFDLPPPNFKLVDERDQVFYGIVSKICFPSVALVTIPGLKSTVSIHVHGFLSRPKFHTKYSPGRLMIANYVKLNDCVQFKVEKLKAFPKILCSYDVEVVEGPKEVLDKVYAGLLPRKPTNNANRKTSEVDNCQFRATVSSSSSSSSTPEPAMWKNAKTDNAEASKSGSDTSVCIASYFKRGVLSQGRAFLIDCPGTIKVDPDGRTKEKVSVEHIFGSTKLTSSVLYMSGGSFIPVDNMLGLNSKQIRFDAIAPMSLDTNGNFTIVRMWDTTDKRPPSERHLFTELRLVEGLPLTCCPGKITSVPLFDAAVATVKNVPVLVPFDSVATLQEVNHGCSSIDMFLNVGDSVGLKFERRNFTGVDGSYFRAVRCWTLSKGGEKISPDDQLRMCEPRVNSWFTKWGYGYFFRKGIVKKREDKFFVNFPPEKKAARLSLDLFEKGKVFVNGTSAKTDDLEKYIGKPITCHVAHEYVDTLGDDKSREMFAPEGMFVASSWIGKDVSAERMLKDVLAVPKGMICSNWLYEVLIDSFPLPTHAIGFIGYVPVLVPLSNLNMGDTFVGVEDVNIKKGDRILVRVLEDQEGDTTYLVVNESCLKKVGDCEYKEVLKNVSGRIEKLPNPTGLIKLCKSNEPASFELCHLRRFLKGPGTDRKWLESLKSKLFIGKRVFLSAVKVKGKTAPYRAFEVYFKS